MPADPVTLKLSTCILPIEADGSKCDVCKDLLLLRAGGFFIKLDGVPAGKPLLKLCGSCFDCLSTDH